MVEQWLVVLPLIYRSQVWLRMRPYTTTLMLVIMFVYVIVQTGPRPGGGRNQLKTFCGPRAINFFVGCGSANNKREDQ